MDPLSEALQERIMADPTARCLRVPLWWWLKMHAESAPCKCGKRRCVLAVVTFNDTVILPDEEDMRLPP